MIEQAIEQYALGASVPLRGIAGLTREELLAFPVPGTWSIQQIVLHLMDSDLVASDRMKRVIAEDKPLLLNYDENLFTARLHYEELDAQQAVELFRLNRELTANILRRLPPADFERVGIHTQAGIKSLLDLVQGYISHLEGHMFHLRHKRELLGKRLN
ncbi:MAG TPA: DinB family protein [Pirellulaceae bacterium]|nr:DinB family protein [Pirellulaceae bacterium]